MAWTNKAQIAYAAKRRAEGTIKRATIDITPETAAEWEAYAAHLGVPRATMIRQCIARCMAADGWTMPGAAADPVAGADDLGDNSSGQVDHLPGAIVAEDEQPVKRKRGRPRKAEQ